MMMDNKEREKRFHECIQEIIETERVYVMKLQTVVDVFIIPLKQYNMINASIINANEIQIQFNCWEVLCNIHSEFYDTLLQKQQDDVDFHHHIGSLFLEFSENLKLYKNYLLNFNLYQNHRTAILNNKSSKYNKKYYQFLEAAKQNPECNWYTLEMFLIEPLQRVSQYKNLLEKLLRYIPIDETLSDTVNNPTSLLISKKSASIYEYDNNARTNINSNNSNVDDVNDSFSSTNSSNNSFNNSHNNHNQFSPPPSIITTTSSSSPLYSSITEALSKIYEVAIENNNAFTRFENRMQIMNMMQSLDPKTRINLLDDPQRKLLKTGELQLLHSTTGLTVYRFWLFSDKLVYGKPVRSTRSSFSPSFTSSSSKSPLPSSMNNINSNTTNPFDASSQTNSSNTKRRGSASSVGSVNSTASSNFSMSDNNNNTNNKHTSKQSLFTLSLPEINLLECRVTKKSDGCAFKVLSVMGELLLSALTHEDKCDWIDAINDAVADLTAEELQQQQQSLSSSSSSRDSFGNNTMNTNPTTTAAAANSLIQVSSRKNSFSSEIDRFQQLALALQPQLSSRGGQQLSSNMIINNSASGHNTNTLNTATAVGGAGAAAVGRVRGRTSGSMSLNVNICEQCSQTYTKKNTKQMCMNCGANICEDCSTKRFLLILINTSSTTPSRVCNPCYVSLCLGGSEANITEPLPSRFLPAPQELLLQKSLQKLNTKSCNVCKIDYSTWRVSTTCVNCFKTVCENCCQKKYLISYIDTSMPCKVCNDCFGLFESGLGGEAFTRHIAGSSNDNPHHQKRSLTHTRSRSCSAANPTELLQLEQQTQQQQQHSQKHSSSSLSHSHHSHSNFMTSTNIFDNNNSGNGIVSGGSGNSSARSASSPRSISRSYNATPDDSGSSRGGSTTVAGGVNSLTRESLSQLQSQPQQLPTAQSRLLLRQSTGSVQSQSRALLRLSSGGVSDMSMSPRPTYAPPLPPTMNSSRSTNNSNSSNHDRNNINNTGINHTINNNNNNNSIKNNQINDNSNIVHSINNISTNEIRIIRPLSASSSHSSRRSSRSSSPFGSSSNNCTITDMTAVTGTSVASANTSPRIISPLPSSRSNYSESGASASNILNNNSRNNNNNNSSGVTIRQPKSILSKSSNNATAANTSTTSIAVTTSTPYLSKNNSILSPRQQQQQLDTFTQQQQQSSSSSSSSRSQTSSPIPSYSPPSRVALQSSTLQPQLSFTYEPECPEVLLELASSPPKPPARPGRSSFSLKSQSPPSQQVLNKREAYDDESYGSLTQRSSSSKSIHSSSGGNGNGNGGNGSGSGMLFNSTGSSNNNNNSINNSINKSNSSLNGKDIASRSTVKTITTNTTAGAAGTGAVSPIKPKKPLMTKDMIMASSHNAHNSSINNSNNAHNNNNGIIHNSRIRTFSEPPVFTAVPAPAVDNTHTAYYSQYKPRNTIMSSLSSITGGSGSSHNSHRSSSTSSSTHTSPRGGVATSATHATGALSPGSHSRSRSASMGFSYSSNNNNSNTSGSSGSGKDRTSCNIM